eukprot:scaffold28956_cov69-Phaeocystis_antarctica.AAC.3
MTLPHLSCAAETVTSSWSTALGPSTTRSQSETPAGCKWKVEDGVGVEGKHAAGFYALNHQSRLPVVSITAPRSTRVPSAWSKQLWRIVPRMSSKVGCNSFWMSRPTLHRTNARDSDPAGRWLGRNLPTMSHLTQVSTMADAVAVSSSRRNNRSRSNGSIPGQPTISAASVSPASDEVNIIETSAARPRKLHR